ncbi:hypothetical protein ACFFSH_38430 [Streptomyces filamentosus]|uniref:Uncharacterized protein n=1 Tax=Streptomyces filamentosus TaxID=67294 RepID=A0A919B9J8_STRFL|nr:hypothetical protein [Streptomyces filamentosus]GHF77064.1 hypothetical protein GCM10017667_00440 [Streptomyces filamentosus]
MPRIKLAHWVGDHKPGDEIDVSDTELASLNRDGRVAAVVDVVPDPPTPLPEPAALAVAPQAEPAAGETGRRRR